MFQLEPNGAKWYELEPAVRNWNKFVPIGTRHSRKFENHNRRPSCMNAIDGRFPRARSPTAKGEVESWLGFYFPFFGLSYSFQSHHVTCLSAVKWRPMAQPPQCLDSPLPTWEPPCNLVLGVPSRTAVSLGNPVAMWSPQETTSAWRLSGQILLRAGV